MSDPFTPTALQSWWAGLPDVARGFLRRTINPHNLTQVHLAHLIARKPAQFSVGTFTYGRPKVRFPESGAALAIGRYGSIADGVAAAAESIDSGRAVAVLEQVIAFSSELPA